MTRKLFCILFLIAVHGFLGAAENLVDFNIIPSGERTFVFYRDGYDANNKWDDPNTSETDLVHMPVHYIIEVMDWQRYAAGSIYREMRKAPLEAQKAQAVASRTVALRQIRHIPGTGGTATITNYDGTNPRDVAYDCHYLNSESKGQWLGWDLPYEKPWVTHDGIQGVDQDRDGIITLDEVAGFNPSHYSSAIDSAVADTEDQILTYSYVGGSGDLDPAGINFFAHTIRSSSQKNFTCNAEENFTPKAFGDSYSYLQRKSPSPEVQRAMPAGSVPPGHGVGMSQVGACVMAGDPRALTTTAWKDIYGSSAI